MLKLQKKNNGTNEPQNYLPKNDYKTYIWWEIATTTVPSRWYYNVLFDWHNIYVWLQVIK